MSVARKHLIGGCELGARGLWAAALAVLIAGLAAVPVVLDAGQQGVQPLPEAGREEAHHAQAGARGSSPWKLAMASASFRRIVSLSSPRQLGR